MFVNLLKSILHNIGVVIVGLGIAYLGTRADALWKRNRKVAVLSCPSIPMNAGRA